MVNFYLIKKTELFVYWILIVTLISTGPVQDLIIEVIYADIVRGKLDQKHQHVEVDYAIGRDIRPENVKEITFVLEEW